MGSSNGSHECGEIKNDGDPCTRPVDGPDDICWQHQEGGSSAGQPPHEPTDLSRTVVESLAMEGRTQEEIAEMIGLSQPTLRKYYRQEIDKAKMVADAQVVQTAYKMAVSGESASMTRYWLNCNTDSWEKTDKVDVTSDGESLNKNSRSEILERMKDMDTAEAVKEWKRLQGEGDGD